jgi:hypothetical protein
LLPVKAEIVLAGLALVAVGGAVADADQFASAARIHPEVGPECGLRGGHS